MFRGLAQFLSLYIYLRMINDRIWTLVSRKLSGEATASELAEIESISTSPDGKKLYLQAIEEYWATPPEKDNDFLEATYHLHLNRLKAQGFDLDADPDIEEFEALSLDDVESPQQKTTNKINYLAGGLLGLFVLCIFLVYRPRVTTPKLADAKLASSEVSTKSGSRTKIVLPDGSSVWLNGSSKLVYSHKGFGDKLREVTLSGEAYFDVVKNPAIPFIIHTKKMEIKVIGTAFNVKAYPGEKNTETSLIRGSIEVTVKGRRETIMMKPNDKLVLLNDQVPADDGVSANDKLQGPGKDPFIKLGQLTFSAEDHTVLETAWVENKLSFDNEAFEDVAIKMERWYGVQIRFNDEKLKNFHMTGTFEKQTVTEALQALQYLSPFTYTVKNDTITIANK